MKRFLMMCMVAVAVSALANPRLVPLTVQEMGRYGATDALVIDAELTESTANTAQTNTVTLTGPCSWEYRGYLLDKPFDASSVTNLMTCALTVSVGSQALVSAVQIASDQYRLYKAITPTAVTITNAAYTNYTGSATGAWPYSGTLTNGATATITTILGAPGSAHTLNKVDTGQARLFFRVLR